MVSWVVYFVDFTWGSCYNFNVLYRNPLNYKEMLDVCKLDEMRMECLERKADEAAVCLNCGAYVTDMRDDTIYQWYMKNEDGLYACMY